MIRASGQPRQEVAITESSSIVGDVCGMFQISDAAHSVLCEGLFGPFEVNGGIREGGCGTAAATQGIAEIVSWRNE